MLHMLKDLFRIIFAKALKKLLISIKGYEEVIKTKKTGK